MLHAGGLAVFLLLGLLTLLAIGSLARGFIRAVRYGVGERPPFEPVVDPNPPAPVGRTAAVAVVAAAAMAWCLGHLAVGLFWSMTGRWVERTTEAAMAAIYACFAASLTGAGGLMLSRRVAYGRRMISWGQFLLGVGAFLGFAIALLLPQLRKAPLQYRQAWAPIAAACGAYLVVATAVGAAAQHVGVPPGRRGEAGPSPPAER